jgi:hypothetical protein
LRTVAISEREASRSSVWPSRTPTPTPAPSRWRCRWSGSNRRHGRRDPADRRRRAADALEALREGITPAQAAKLPDPRAAQLAKLADELHVSKSALIDEALSLLFTGLIEARKGHRFAIIDAKTQRVISQVATPSLSQLEWTTYSETIELSPAALSQIAELNANPPPPTPALRRAMARHRGKARR